MTKPQISSGAMRLSGWSLVVAGVGAGIVLPHPVTTTLWTAAPSCSIVSATAPWSVD